MSKFHFNHCLVIICVFRQMVVISSSLESNEIVANHSETSVNSTLEYLSSTSEQDASKSGTGLSIRNLPNTGNSTIHPPVKDILHILNISTSTMSSQQNSITNSPADPEPNLDFNGTTIKSLLANFTVHPNGNFSNGLSVNGTRPNNETVDDDEVLVVVSDSFKLSFFQRLWLNAKLKVDAFIAYSKGNLFLSILLPASVGLAAGLTALVVFFCVSRIRLASCLHCIINLLCCCWIWRLCKPRHRFRKATKDKEVEFLKDENHYLLVPNQMDSDSEI